MKNVIKIEKDALSKRVQLSGIRLEFLVLYADLQEEDFLLNSNVFGQPEFRFDIFVSQSFVNWAHSCP